MPQKYTSKQFWKLYEKLPQELRDAVFSQEVGNDIFEICSRYNLLNSHEDMINYVGQVLIGLLPPEEFEDTIEVALRLKKSKAKKISQEIYRYVFYPVKENLEKLYRMEIAPLAKMPVTPPPSEKPPEPPKKKDVYREPVGGGEEEDVYKESIK